MEYQELKSGIKDHLNSAAEDFFMVGYFLRQISENALFTEDGYKNIWDFAKGEYGLSTSSASRFMAINARFSIDGGEHMAEKYIGMGVSKLQEMLGLPDEELEKVTQETTVREIRAMKKKQEEPKSFFGFSKTVRPEGSLLTTKGCGDGKYDCFSCCRECAIRQEPRQCRTAPCGNPFPCDPLSNEQWKKNIQYSLYKDECQLLHPELAPIREGDKEPDPCCLHCQNKTCFNRCDVAKKRDEEERKKVQEEERKRQKEAEAKKPEPSEADIKAFYDWIRLKTTDNISADDLKARYRNASGGGGSYGLKDYQGSARGIRINYKREITWAQLAKRLKEVQEAEKKKADFVERSNGAQKNVRELIKQQEEKRKQEAEAKKAEKKAKPQELPEQQEPKIIDADFKEVEPDRQEPERNDEAQEQNDEAQERNDELQEDQEPEIIEDPESYTLADVKEQLRKHEADLKAYREVGDLPSPMMQKQKILVDALQLLVEKKEFDEKEAAGID